MDPAYKLSRRGFLQASIAMAAAAGAGVGCEAGATPWRFFSVDEARTLAAICDQIIPPDGDPGAAWAGVVNYIDRQLSGPLASLRNSYRLGLAAVDHNSRTLHSNPFPDATPIQQIELLRRMERGQAPSEPWKQITSIEFFTLVLDHTMQGFYGDPRHGGNREGISWKILGIPYPPIRGRFRPEFKS
ncbi:MAG TPA: gluconate 2-dehydrogenase subunit 3 family protein [Candidatus Sulfotelmatobacter sp.]|nr:gluconate 2-dehydrogenase subunit 3 family protein [Candidatus Sulfotelmatobacter sp.]